MEWTQHGLWFIESDQGYRLSKAIGLDGVVYAAWTPDRKAMFYTDSAKKAKEFCENDCKAANRDVARAGGSP